MGEMTEQEALKFLQKLSEDLYDTLYMYGDSDDEIDRAGNSSKYKRQESTLKDEISLFESKFGYKPKV
jgi:hypothetical protein